MVEKHIRDLQQIRLNLNLQIKISWHIAFFTANACVSRNIYKDLNTLMEQCVKIINHIRNSAVQTRIFQIFVMNGLGTQSVATTFPYNKSGEKKNIFGGSNYDSLTRGVLPWAAYTYYPPPPSSMQHPQQHSYSTGRGLGLRPVWSWFWDNQQGRCLHDCSTVPHLRLFVMVD